MRATRISLKKWSACEDGFKWWCDNCEGLSNIDQIKKLMSSKCPDLDWANWLIVRIMTKKQCLAYCIYAAELVIKNYEKEYPNDDRPRKAIEAARIVMKRNTKENRSAARSAARSAESAWSAAEPAWSAAWSARSAAWSARSAAWSARSAESAARSAGSARSAAEPAARSAARSAGSAAFKGMQLKILRNGIKILKGE